MELYVLDRYLNPVPIGVEGELCIGGASVARGYWNREDLTRKRFVRDPYSNKPNSRLYRSGDRARLLPTGEIEYLGKPDGQANAPGDKHLTAYVVASEASLTTQDLRAYLADSLPAPDSGQRSGREYVAPRTADEKALADIWAEVLRVEQVGVEDDIFELGADSHHVSQISARAKTAGIAITPKQLLAQGTIARLLLDAGAGQEEVMKFRVMDKAS